MYFNLLLKIHLFFYVNSNGFVFHKNLIDWNLFSTSVSNFVSSE